MDCIVLAGGLGTRLRGAVPDLPKPLAPIQGTPFLDLLLHKLFKLPISRVILALGYKAECIVAKYQNDARLVFSIEETPLGTGGALLKAAELVRSEHFLALNGDTWLDFSFATLLQKHIHQDAEITICCVEGETGWINGGVYLIKTKGFREIPLTPPFSLETEAFPLLAEKKMCGHFCIGQFIDIGSPEMYHKAQQILCTTF